MRKTISLLLCAVMTLSVFCIGVSAAGGTIPAEYQIGTINAADGLDNPANKTRLYTPDFIPLADAEGVTINVGYQLSWLAYGKDMDYLGNGNNFKGLWQPNGGPIRCAEIRALYPEAVYFRFGIRNTAGSTITLDAVADSGVTIVAIGGSLTGNAGETTKEILGTVAIPTEFRIGTINAADGLDNPANKTRLYTPDYIPLADAAGVMINAGYQLAWLAYGKDKEYLGNGNNYKGLWQPDGGPIRSADILAIYPDAVYFRFGMKNLAGTAIDLSEVEKSGVMVVAAPAPETAPVTEPLPPAPVTEPLAPVTEPATPVQTGDNAVWFAVVLAVAVLGCAFAVRKGFAK